MTTAYVYFLSLQSETPHSTCKYF